MRDNHRSSKIHVRAYSSHFSECNWNVTHTSTKSTSTTTSMARYREYTIKNLVELASFARALACSRWAFIVRRNAVAAIVRFCFEYTLASFAVYFAVCMHSARFNWRTDRQTERRTESKSAHLRSRAKFAFAFASVSCNGLICLTSDGVRASQFHSNLRIRAATTQPSTAKLEQQKAYHMLRQKLIVFWPTEFLSKQKWI